MAFCVHCGAQLNPQGRYCSACGQSSDALPAPLSPPPPSPSVAVPTQLNSGTEPIRKRPRHIFRNIVLIVFGIAVTATVLFVTNQPKPEDSIEKVRTAYLQRDAATFDEYVDVQSILNDWTDQVLRMWVDSGKDQLEAMGIAAAAKTFFVPKIAPSVEQAILSRQVVNTEGGDVNYITSFLSNGIRALIASQISYQGVASESQYKPDVCLDLSVGTSISAQTFLVKVVLERSGDHWRIVKINDLGGLLQQLHPGPNISLSYPSKATAPPAAAPAEPAVTQAPSPPHPIVPAVSQAPAPPPAPVVAAPLSSPAPPAAFPGATSKPVEDDPMKGDGGFIHPPKAIAPDLKVDVCVPPDLVDKLSWDNPAPESEMAAFKTFLKNFVRNYADGRTIYRITDDAFDRFDRGQRASAPYDPNPFIVFIALPAGRECPATNYVYTVTVPARN